MDGTPDPDDPGLRFVCQDLVELLTDYLDGVLEPARQTEVEAHLRLCPPCRAYLAQIRETVGRLGRVEATDRLSSGVRAEVLAVFRDVMPVREA